MRESPYLSEEEIGAIRHQYIQLPEHAIGVNRGKTEGLELLIADAASRAALEWMKDIESEYHTAVMTGQFDFWEKYSIRKSERPLAVLIARELEREVSK